MGESVETLTLLEIERRDATGRHGITRASVEPLWVPEASAEITVGFDDSCRGDTPAALCRRSRVGARRLGSGYVYNCPLAIGCLFYFGDCSNCCTISATSRTFFVATVCTTEPTFHA